MIFYGILSLQDMAIIKVAIEVCNNPELKREILCAASESYDEVKWDEDQYGSKEQQEIVEKEATVILGNLGIAKLLKEKVTGIVLLVGMRMLTWAEYHEGIVGFSRYYSINFLNNSFFTQRGIIDNKKAAEELMSDKNLSTEQKYKLACLYCFTDHIPALYKQIKDDKEKFCSTGPRRVIQTGLVMFWSYYLMGKVDEIRGEKTLDQYRLEKAVESGSKAAVEYCLEKTNLSWEKDAIVDAAVEAVRNWVNAKRIWIVFRNRRYGIRKETWVPYDYYVDIISFLLPKMTEIQQIEFLKKDIESAIYLKADLKVQGHSRILRYFLNWPYQEYFMKTAELMWEFLPESDYAILLLKVCEKIESKKENNLKYGEQKSYDYRGLFKEFWFQSPERYKMYVLSNKEVNYKDYRNVTVDIFKTGAGLLTMLLTLKTLTNEDEKNIEMIFGSATDKRKENILTNEEWNDICFRLMKVEEWERLDRFVLDCYSSEEQANECRRELIFTDEARRVCLDFVEKDKWNSVESFIRWSSLPEEEINLLKKEMISSNLGMRACMRLISCDKKVESVDKFIKWCFLSEEEVKAFKKQLIFSDWGTGKCSDLVTEDKLDLVSEFIHSFLSSEEEIRELKKKVAYTYGSEVCEHIITDNEEVEVNDDGDFMTKFKAIKWEDVEKFLTWCFLSEEEIKDFKKNVLLKESGKEIHFSLIESNLWEEAEIFFAWLGLSTKEIKDLKEETLFCHAALQMFMDMMYSEDGAARFENYGSKQEAIELHLRWFLTDKEIVLEFNDHFKEHYDTEEVTQEDRDVLKNFDLAITQRLSDLEEEQRCVKRKSETFPL